MPLALQSLRRAALPLGLLPVGGRLAPSRTG